MVALDLASVIGATLIAVAIGVVWYAPQVFGTLWAQGLGKKVVVEEGDTLLPLWRFRFFFGVIIYGLFFFGLGHILMILQEHALQELASIVGALALGVGLITAGFGVWEERPVSYIIINSVYVAVIIVVGSVVMLWWPW